MDDFEQYGAVLTPAEILPLKLRKLYSGYGYRRCITDRFEPYDLYRENRNFLDGEGILTFTAPGGRLMALKPDVTISIIKNTDPNVAVSKVFYNENVFRLNKTGRDFCEISQMGLEYIGAADARAESEVVRLALLSLDEIDANGVLNVGHMGFVGGLLDYFGFEGAARAELLNAVSRKNTVRISEICSQNSKPEAGRVLSELCSPSADTEAAFAKASALALGEAAQAALSHLRELFAIMGDEPRLRLDFSAVNDAEYYNGIVLNGYVGSTASAVLSGGRYDNLMRRFGKPQPALGFAIYLGELERALSVNPTREDGGMLNIALPKGRLGDKVYELFSGMGYDCPDINSDNRRLVFENPEKGVRYLLVKPSDVAIYVEHGAADIGVSGRDTLLESRCDVYELADLGIGKCRLAVAAKNGWEDSGELVLRVATKYPRAAQDYYASVNRPIEIIKLHGSIELAPILGLSDVIVDIVESGKTLAENDLGVRAVIAESSARLIANKSAYQFHGRIIDDICSKITEGVK